MTNPKIVTNGMMNKVIFLFKMKLKMKTKNNLR
jgi:hypothetical protein